jgi:hypothetical protein
VKGPPQQSSRCLTAEAVADLATTFSPVSRTTNSNCEPGEQELTPLRLKWRLICRGQLDVDLDGDFSFDKPEHYTAIVTMRGSMAGQLMQESRTYIEGTRVGDCP